MYSSPRWQCAHDRAQVALRAAGHEQRRLVAEQRAIFSCSALTLGSSPNTSSPSGAAAIAARIAGGRPRHGVAAQVDDRVHGTCIQEVLQHRVAVLGEDRLGVELHAFDARLVRQAGVAHAHDLAVARVQAVISSSAGQRRALDRQRVVAVDGEASPAGRRRRPAAVVVISLGLAVHQLLRRGRSCRRAPRRSPGGRGRRRGSAACRRSAGSPRRRCRPRPASTARARAPARSGCSARDAVDVISSLRNTCTSAPSSPKYCTRLKVKLS